MSKYRKIKVEFHSEQALKLALEDAVKECKIQFEHHPEGAHLYGWHGRRRQEKAEYIIRRAFVGGAANDIGFAQQLDGSFEMLISEHDTRQYENGHRQFVDVIKQRYAYHFVIERAYSQGYTVYEETLEDGTVQLALERAY